jgi:hemolysin D
MEPLTNYNITGYNFTLWFFRIVAAMMLTIIVLVFVLRINETIAIKQGEVVAGNPQSNYKAPFEGEIISIHVKEGQQVKVGDTLLTMKNLDFREQHAKIRTEIEYLQKKIESIGVLQSAIEKRKQAINQATSITEKKYQLEVTSLVTDMKNLDEQYNMQRERLSSARERYIGDSILYKKDMLSKYELNNTKDANLALRENLTTLQSQKNKHLSEKNISYNNFTKEQNNLLLTKVQLEENAQALVQAKNDYESQLIQAKELFNKLELELGKQNIVATTSGIVNYLFNTKQASNLINKGELLVSVSPKTVSYYAKVVVPEQDMPYIKVGLDAKFKLDAFNRFQNGLIDGKISYVAERKENDQFFALIELLETNRFNLKSGYSVYGEIIVQRLPLYKYFIKKLFKKFDNK